MIEDPPEVPPRSAVATELRALPRQVRRLFGIPDTSFNVMDAVIASVHELADDELSVEQRLRNIPDRFASLFPQLEPSEKLSYLASLSEEELKSHVDRYMSRFKDGSSRRFLHRLVGTARFRRLVNAFDADMALLLMAVRRWMREFMPVIQGLADAASVLTPDERSAAPAMSDTEAALLGAIVQIDKMIGAFFDKRDIDLSSLGFALRDSETVTLDLTIDDLVAAMRIVLDNEVARRAGELSEVLARKLRGFEQALSSSDDGVAQAASSLVEFIDMLLRTAFTTEEVLAWIAAYRSGAGLTYVTPDGRTMPTKHAEALCFAYAGDAPSNESTVEPLVALSIVRVRKRAEKIKHADLGTAEEAQLLRELMDATQGALTFIIRFGWALSDTSYQRLRDRFTQAA